MRIRSLTYTHNLIKSKNNFYLKSMIHSSVKAYRTACAIAWRKSFWHYFLCILRDAIISLHYACYLLNPSKSMNDCTNKIHICLCPHSHIIPVRYISTYCIGGSTSHDQPPPLPRLHLGGSYMMGDPAVVGWTQGCARNVRARDRDETDKLAEEGRDETRRGVPTKLRNNYTRLTCYQKHNEFSDTYANLYLNRMVLLHLTCRYNTVVRTYWSVCIWQ